MGTRHFRREKPPTVAILNLLTHLNKNQLCERSILSGDGVKKADTPSFFSEGKTCYDQSRNCPNFFSPGLSRVRAEKPNQHSRGVCASVREKKTRN